jgi:hypothetical protein
MRSKIALELLTDEYPGEMHGVGGRSFSRDLKPVRESGFSR